MQKDDEIDVKSILIRERKGGVLAVNKAFGRGTDLKFSIDSHVVVCFEPENMSELLQLVGRSSRTHKQHHGSVVIKSDQHDTNQIGEYL